MEIRTVQKLSSGKIDRISGSGLSTCPTLGPNLSDLERHTHAVGYQRSRKGEFEGAGALENADAGLEVPRCADPGGGDPGYPPQSYTGGGGAGSPGLQRQSRLGDVSFVRRPEIGHTYR